MSTLPLGPAAVDITGVRAGDRNLMSVTITSGGQPLDLTGFVVTAQARKTSTDSKALDARIDVVDAAAGRLTVSWPGDDVRELIGNAARFNGVWDLQVVDSSDALGDAVTLAAGRFDAEMDVTR